MAKQWSIKQGEDFWKTRLSLYFQPSKKVSTHIRDGNSHKSEIITFPKSDVGNLRFWIKYLSWEKCNMCDSLSTTKLLPNFSTRFKSSANVNCPCENPKYYIPRPHEIPEVLSMLDRSDIKILRPFDIDLGKYEHKKYGYRVRNAMFSLNCSKLTVQEKINNISDNLRRFRCQQAYDYLMSSNRSSYAFYVMKRAEFMTGNKQPSKLEVFHWEGIECALWPSLYPYTEWCESILHGAEDRSSSRISFFFKCFSSIIDYSLNFSLLQFVFDRWMFKTITGAITEGHYRKCSPYTSLASKPFSPAFWEWQHRYLLDVVRQFGYPSLFVTFSPSEWTFLPPEWLQQLRDTFGFSPTETPLFETYHFMNVLEQIVRGYLCGTNSQRWKTHIFNYCGKANKTSVRTFFYRFEFQSRGTVHIHLLVWLTNYKQTRYKTIRADIPSYDDMLHPYVLKHQLSDKQSPCLLEQNCPTFVEHSNNCEILHIQHPADAFAANLRAYIDTLLPSLCCSMDIQTTDGKGMVLRYVTSYVSKWSETFHRDSLFCQDVNARHAAFRYLINLNLCEPEMWALLSTSKLSFCHGSTVSFTPPTPENAGTNTDLSTYYARPEHQSELSFLQWLRLHNTSAKKSRSSDLPVFVGVKYFSIFNPLYFYQLLLMNYPHKDINCILPENHDGPGQIVYFRKAISLLPDLFEPSNFRLMLQAEGNKNSFIDTAVSYIQSLKDLMQSFERKLFSNYCQTQPNNSCNHTLNLSGKQLFILQVIKSQTRDRHLEYSQGVFDNSQWKKFTLVTGKPGTGKSHLLKACIDFCIEDKQNVLVCTPTGTLSCIYKALYGDKITTNTVHAAFKYPCSEDEKKIINWDLGFYDIIFLDEISQVSIPIFKHIAHTLNILPVRPLVFLCGDFAQQQPIATIDGKVVQVPSLINDNYLLTLCTQYNLTEQFRISDNFLLSFLTHIRHWKPNANQLDKLQSRKVICSDDNVCPDDIQRAVLLFPNALFLTVSNSAADFINNAIMSMNNERPIISVISCTTKLEKIPIYHGLPVMLLENRDKYNDFVNGQICTIHSMEGATVLVRHPKGHMINVYKITCQQTNKTYYPFRPAYACTIAKVQGQTLPRVILWLDTPTTPAGTAYVALSRVQHLNDISFLTKLKPCHFTAVEAASE